ncbi:hypothetical protein ABB29_05210 [Pseudoxanthomonas dokdonensis]|uniref:Uncharacterized protein n=1 Tax=Pseudoxanthomonas dokdonensis TaxID=344882 RepID=A0A0R0CY13_9GAMM|nr:hypothetical protein ABB29_05210 [Pseudoxanthomonas dokdonensis]
MAEDSTPTAGGSPAPAPGRAPDPTIAAQLKQLGYEYEVDQDGDYRLLMGFNDSPRSQIVFIRSATESYGKYRIREIWSYAYQSSGDALPALVANRLLEASNQLILGSWVKQGNHAVYVAKIPADARAEALGDALDAAASSADDMELELAADINTDEF